MRKIGFKEAIIKMILRLIDNNWYSIITNRKLEGLFHSIKGINKGDLVSPALFILVVQVIYGDLSALFKNSGYKGCEIPK